MAQSTKSPIIPQQAFSFSKEKAVVGSFNGGDISSLGGLPIFALVEQLTQFVRGAASKIVDGRRQDVVTHSIYNLVWQRVLLLLAGLIHGLDSRWYRVDPVLKLLLGWAPDGEQHGASPSTISRLENMVSMEDITRILGYMLDFYIKKHKKPPKRIELDVDGSAFEAHGQQQYIAFNAYYDFNMYLPLFVFDQHGWLLTVILRPGNFNDSKLALPMIKVIVARLRKAWPEVEILLRADAAFGDKKIFRWCEEQEKPVLYAIGIKGNNNLHNGSKTADAQVQRLFLKRFGKKEKELRAKDWKKQKKLEGQQASSVPGKQRRQALKRLKLRKIRAFNAFSHQVGNGTGKNKGEPERRVVERIECTDDGLNRRYVATNIEGYSPEHIYENIYGKRGRCELFIKEFKALASPVSCSEATANWFRLILDMLAYNMIQLLREYSPKSLRKMAAATIVNHVVRIAVQVQVTTRKIWLRWTSSYPRKRLFLHMCRRLARAQALSA